MLWYFFGLRTKNAVCVHAIDGHAADAGDENGHAVGVRAVGIYAVGARAVFVHVVGKPSHAVAVRVLRLRTLSGYAVAARAIVYVDGVLTVGIHAAGSHAVPKRAAEGHASGVRAIGDHAVGVRGVGGIDEGIFIIYTIHNYFPSPIIVIIIINYSIQR